MKIAVLVPSHEYRSSAGARIRYGRIAEGLHSLGVELDLVTIGDFDPAKADCDVAVVSKCHDARSLLSAATLSARGKLVGVDLFDDYFSQHGDSRLLSYREWLSNLLKDCDFALCSTQPLAAVVQQYRAGLPAHVVNDPAPDHDPEAAALAAEEKLARALRDRVLHVTWFGVGDNPYFQVGLADLAAHSAALTALARAGMTVRLDVVTNRRSLDADGLELMSRLPIPPTVIEWTEEAEREALDRALVAFLPVAAQSFSAAKSLNRALTALARGCQVLSVGYPLYAALEPLIYSDPDDLTANRAGGRMRFSRTSLNVYRDRLHQFASAETEALRLRTFLQELPPHSRGAPGRLCVVHGFSTRAEVHQMAKALDALSVASPFCSARLDFDVRFTGLPPRMEMQVATGVERGARRGRTAGTAPPPAASLPYQLIAYGSAVKQMEEKLRELFGPLRLIISDTARLPVRGLET